MNKVLPIDFFCFFNKQTESLSCFRKAEQTQTTKAGTFQVSSSEVTTTAKVGKLVRLCYIDMESTQTAARRYEHIAYEHLKEKEHMPEELEVEHLLDLHDEARIGMGKSEYRREKNRHIETILFICTVFVFCMTIILIALNLELKKIGNILTNISMQGSKISSESDYEITVPTSEPRQYSFNNNEPKQPTPSREKTSIPFQKESVNDAQIDFSHFIHEVPVLTDQIKSEYARFFQDRSLQKLGTSPGYTIDIHNKTKVERKVQRYNEILATRDTFCGDFESFLLNIEGGLPANSTTIQESSWNWELVLPEEDEQAPEKVVCGGPSKACGAKSVLNSYRCTFADPSRPNVNITLERVGAFNLPGNYDWGSAEWSDVGGFKHTHYGKTFSVLGGMFVPTMKNGTEIGYPPLHIHHAHLYAYSDMNERSEKTMHNHQDQSDIHHVLLQAHGDTECFAENGGRACWLAELDEGLGHVVYDQRSGFAADFDINNVLSTPLIDVYMDVYILWRDELPEKASTYVHIANGCFGEGTCTYDIPADESSSIWWHRYQFYFPGTAYDFEVHTHQTFSDSTFFIKGKNVFERLDKFRKGLPLPLIVDCHEELGDSLEVAKELILSAVMQVEDAELVCEQVRPNLLLDCTNVNTTGECMVFDKRLAINCQPSIHVDKGDEIVAIAFNRSPPRHWISRDSDFFRLQLYGNEFALKQHTVLRMQFTHDETWTPERASDIPPAFFHYSDYMSASGPIKMDNLTAKEIDILADSHRYISQTCPSSISFNLEQKRVAEVHHSTTTSPAP